jgi:uncharacterized protein YndB with AHSA1/START domain
MKSLSKTYIISAPIEKVWACLTDSNLIEQWGAGPAEFDPVVGGKFNMWGEYLTGEVLEMAKPSRLVEDWLDESFEESSKVSFDLTEANNQTTLNLRHENIPDDRLEDIDKGWDEYYLGAIKGFLEQ